MCHRTNWFSRTQVSLKSLLFHYLVFILFYYYYYYISTWSYENRVSKHFVIFLNFRCLIACLLCCLLMSFVFLACLVVRDLCRSGCRQNYYLAPPPPPPFFSLPTILSLTQVTVISLKSGGA